MRPILIIHKASVLPAECVNEDRNDVFFVRRVVTRGDVVWTTGLAAVANVIFLYGYSPTVDDYSVVRQMRG